MTRISRLISRHGMTCTLLATGLALALLIHGGGKWSFDQRISR